MGGLISKKQILIYDCMDDILEFPEIKRNKLVAEKMFKYERKLIDDSDVVFCSSLNLSNVIQRRYSVDVDKIAIVNNAIANSFLKRYNFNALSVSDDLKYKHITYVGTIDKWFNFSLLERICSKYNSVIFDLYGPVAYKPNDTHPRIIFHGMIPHDQIAGVMSKADMLMMPFVITPLIESVNPVKLYEYIMSGKPTVAVRYEETKCFSEYVYLYSTNDEFEHFIDLLIKESLPSLKSLDEVRHFCEKNTWKERACEIYKVLENVSKRKGERM
jgi:glycosyltransferase involved in cell wall biosynthesis